MAVLKGINIALPGSWGMSTQSEIVDDPAKRFLTDAANGLIDKSGKLVSREDFVLQTAAFSQIVRNVFVHRNTDGTETFMSASDGGVYSGLSSLTLRYTGSTGNDNWQFASLTGKIYFMQKGETPKALDETTFVAQVFVGAPWTSSPNVLMAADGRLWAADDDTGGNRYKVWWSKLLDGLTWNAGDAGSIDLRNVWPAGQDSVVALAFLSTRLVIFGRNSILLYTLPADHNPGTMSLTDTIDGLGCIARDSVVIAGGDLYFLSDSGYYKIPKLAQVTSLLSTTKVSALVADDVVNTFAAEDLTAVRAGYFSREKIITLAAPVSNKTWVFHVDRMVPANDVDKVPAATYWTNSAVAFRGFCHDKSGNFYAAIRNGIAKYTGYTSDGASNAYSFDLYSQWDAMQDETRLKIMKSLAATVETNIGQVFTLRWQFDYKTGTTRTAVVTASATEFAEAPGLGVIRSPIGGAGSVVRYGFTTPIAGDKVTYHSQRLYASPGATKIR